MNHNRNLSQNILRLIEDQMAEWSLLSQSHELLKQVRTRDFEINGYHFKVQFNPSRIISSAARTDPKSILERQCFLCEKNRPEQQKAISFQADNGNIYEILCNPYPISPRHLTIVAQHTPQVIKGRIADMVEFAEELHDFVIFYNGPQCGASAPDHMHFQACNRGFLEIENYIDPKEGVWELKNYPAKTIIISARERTDAIREFETIYRNFADLSHDTAQEPMLNILCYKSGGRYILAIFPRKAHRPRQFFERGDKNMLISPASIDLAGVFITPMEKDFEKITATDVADILTQISVDEDTLAQISVDEDTLAQTIKPLKAITEPEIAVGIVSKPEIHVTLDGVFSASLGRISGDKTVTLRGTEIEFEGKLYSELILTPVNDKSTFTIRDVVIGIGFHWERGEDQRFTGSLKFIIENSAITAINLVSVEDYLESVISSEMSATSSLELLKAHAVISRSWVLSQIEKNAQIKNAQIKNADLENAETKTSDIESAETKTSETKTSDIESAAKTYNSDIRNKNQWIKWWDREDHANFDVCADDHCQRYQGVTRAEASLETVRQAVHETRGELLMHGNQIADARFSKCCGGITEKFENTWEPVPHPYLTPLIDNDNGEMPLDLTIETNATRWIAHSPEAFCNTSDPEIISQILNNYDQRTGDFFRWSVSYTSAELGALILRKTGIDFGEILHLEPIERGDSARIIKLRIAGSKQTLVIGKELLIRKALSPSHLYSSAFTVVKDHDRFTLNGAGWGHGVGLCQIGAAVMAHKGYRYRNILAHYYPGATLEKRY